MKNPYEILGIKQDATKAEIVKAKMNALQNARSMNIEIRDISMAEKQLLKPSKRLAADFMYPTRLKAKRPRTIETDISILPLRFSDLDPDALNSLR